MYVKTAIFYEFPASGSVFVAVAENQWINDIIEKKIPVFTFVDTGVVWR